MGLKKASLGIALILTTCTSLFAHTAALISKSQPLLTNGGFENNLTGWSTATNNGSNATFTITNDVLHVHSGSQGLIVNVINTGTANNSVTFSATPVKLNKKGYYLLRFWAW